MPLSPASDVLRRSFPNDPQQLIQPQLLRERQLRPD